MDHIARALVNVAAFLEFSPDDILDLDSAVKAMEDIAAELGRASNEEREALARVCAKERDIRARTPGYEATAEFFANFIEDFGVGENTQS
jgi:hypothetical protein